jgi:SAM-dependent methyltransferase
LRSEQSFHDEQARLRAHDLATRSLVFTDDSYLDHETWIRPAFARLGGVRDRRVLDLGCGHGMAAVVLARRGARVTGLDLSAGYLAEAEARAAANGVRIDWVAADADRLPFGDDSFDGIWGNAILHHLDLETAGSELERVMRPGGIAVFCEPWGENPLLAWARRRLPHPHKDRTPDEMPLDRAGVDALRRHFPNLKLEGHQLMSMVGRLIGPRPWLARWDARLLRCVPGLQLWCRYAVLTLPSQSSTCRKKAEFS